MCVSSDFCFIKFKLNHQKSDSLKIFFFWEQQTTNFGPVATGNDATGSESVNTYQPHVWDGAC